MAEKEYIERDKAIHAARYTTPMMPSQSRAIVNAIESIPTADVRPVEKTRWIDGACANCGGFFDIMESRYFTYCPNCGSVIEREVDNGG